MSTHPTQGGDGDDAGRGVLGGVSTHLLLENAVQLFQMLYNSSKLNEIIFHAPSNIKGQNDILLMSM